MKALSVLLVCLSATLALGQSLPRRVFLGIRMENLNAESRRVMGLDSTVKGVLITEALPNSTAEKAGFRKSDILLSVNGQRTPNTEATYAALGGKQAGQLFGYEIYRDKKIVKGKATFREMPREQYRGLVTSYTESKSALGLQRMILTRPAAAKGKLPVVAFIGGIGCYSLDFPFDSNSNEVQLTNALARAGFLAARLEKPGMGDGAKYCKPCNEVSFLEETTGYVEAIRALKRRPDVDSSAVFIFGHSMGGVFAPLVAQQTPLRGIVAYGTIGSNFIEYLAKTRRTIGEAENMTPEETDDMIKNDCACAVLYFDEKKTTEQAIAHNPRCKDLLPVFDFRSRAYNDELYGYNIQSLWKPYKGRALLVWGESDYISAKEDHQIIAQTVGYYKNGTATFVSVPAADHGMNKAATFQEAAKIYADGANKTAGYNPAVGLEVVNWLRGQI